MLQYVAIFYSVLQCVAQHTLVHLCLLCFGMRACVRVCVCARVLCVSVRSTVLYKVLMTNCNTLQRVATHCKSRCNATIMESLVGCGDCHDYSLLVNLYEMCAGAVCGNEGASAAATPATHRPRHTHTHAPTRTHTQIHKHRERMYVVSI